MRASSHFVLSLHRIVILIGREFFVSKFDLCVCVHLIFVIAGCCAICCYFFWMFFFKSTREAYFSFVASVIVHIAALFLSSTCRFQPTSETGKKNSENSLHLWNFPLRLDKFQLIDGKRIAMREIDPTQNGDHTRMECSQTGKVWDSSSIVLRVRIVDRMRDL